MEIGAWLRVLTQIRSATAAMPSSVIPATTLRRISARSVARSRVGWHAALAACLHVMRLTLRPTIVLALVTTAACTALGPVPVATGISPIPRARFDGELQLGAMPGFYLSSATTQSPKGSPLLQLAAVIEPSGAVPGLIVGGR